MKLLMLFFSAILFDCPLQAQQANELIQQGNSAYKKADYATASDAYSKALKIDPNNLVGQFNLANSLYKQLQFENATTNYLNLIKSTPDPSILSKAWYNLGNSFIKQKKIQDAINAYRQSLLINPSDNDTRENLQKAMSEKQNQNKNNQSNKEAPKNPKQPKNTINQALAEQFMQQLRDQEKQLQKQLQQKPPSEQKGKDW
ncbi:MAG: tetratricopeptide repeat protein [Bacteroidetes bacterium]|nr:tetratricopeptide repeat protein [Bacteroidota bacterium]